MILFKRLSEFLLDKSLVPSENLLFLGGVAQTIVWTFKRSLGSDFWGGQIAWFQLFSSDLGLSCLFQAMWEVAGDEGQLAWIKTCKPRSLENNWNQAISGSRFVRVEIAWSCKKDFYRLQQDLGCSMGSSMNPGWMCSAYRFSFVSSMQLVDNALRHFSQRMI